MSSSAVSSRPSETAGQAANTYVLFTSDHGLAVGSHGLRGKQNMYEHTVGVPLIIAGPQVPAGKRSAAQCYLRDMYPTVCELAGIEIPQDRSGAEPRAGDSRPDRLDLSRGLRPFPRRAANDTHRSVETDLVSEDRQVSVVRSGQRSRGDSRTWRISPPKRPAVRSCARSWKPGSMQLAIPCSTSEYGTHVLHVG